MRSLLGGPGGADAATVLRTLVVAAGRGAGGSVWIEARRGGPAHPQSGPAMLPGLFGGGSLLAKCG